MKRSEVDDTNYVEICSNCDKIVNRREGGYEWWGSPCDREFTDCSLDAFPDTCTEAEFIYAFDPEETEDDYPIENDSGESVILSEYESAVDEDYPIMFNK